jgi:Fe-S-cluster containining protein
MARGVTTDLDCRACGACCAAEIKLPWYVGLTGADLERMTPQWRARHVVGTSILTRVDLRGNCVCVALRGTVGRRAWCTIYERRPGACRRLKAGGRACRKARQQAGIEAGHVRAATMAGRRSS